MKKKIEAKKKSKAKARRASPSASCSGLASRWTPAQIEFANKLVNDIAEEIDNGESRENQRQAIAILADMLYDAHEAKRAALMEIGFLAFRHITDESPNAVRRGAPHVPDPATEP